MPKQKYDPSKPEIHPSLAFALGRCAECDGPTHGFIAPLKPGQTEAIVWLPLCIVCRDRSLHLPNRKAYTEWVRHIAGRMEARLYSWEAIDAKWNEAPDRVDFH